ncbi:MAG: sugar ABC transporter permease [Chloroflexi bacterium]|nr:sugar ABC transporter permease [Chloroflexota bacterium]MCL5275355.1 sugar ABC transporter permease [Chloroflexota bacterium]
MAKATNNVSLAPARRRRGVSPAQRRQNLYGYLFLTPWLIGFFGLFIGPGLYSFYLSFTKYDVLSAPVFISLKNYTDMFTKDDLFWPSLARTAYFALVSVPLSVIGSMLLAILLNSKLRGITVYRTLFFMPSLVPIVASVVLFKVLLDSSFGLVNQGLRGLGMENPPGWFADSKWAIPSLILMRLWGSLGGTQMIIFLAGLQGIPTELYDAAAIDGANSWQSTRHVTIPLLTPTIFFNTVLGVIGALQTFVAAFVATQGGPAFATWFFALHIWKQAFDYFNMGYAAALAWFFAVIIVALTLVQMRLSRRLVFYYGE